MKRWVPILALVTLGVVCCGRGAWILVKAEIAQVLLDRAWQRTLDGEDQVRPWSWADTWPVARLRAPAHDAEMIVLEGATGAVLAFGPGHLAGSSTPGDPGHVVLAGHRDTHFAFLRDLQAGDELWLDAGPASRHRYRVESFQIVEDTDTSVLEGEAGDVLTLVTCYPFDSVVPGGTSRYVVRAVRA